MYWQLKELIGWKINKRRTSLFAPPKPACPISQSFLVTMKRRFYCTSGRLVRAILIQSLEYFKWNSLHIYLHSTFFCAEKVEWKSIFLWTSLLVIALAIQKRFSRKVVRATWRKFWEVYFIYFSNQLVWIVFALLIVPLFPQKWTSPFSDRIRREQALPPWKLVSITINNRQKGCVGFF